MNILRMNCWYLKQLPDNGGLVLEIVEQTHHPGCHFLI